MKWSCPDLEASWNPCTPKSTWPRARKDRNTQAPKAFVTVAALGVAGVGMYGSGATLYRIGTEDQVAAPWTLPFCLDALAIICTAAAVFAAQNNLWVRWGSRLGYLASAILQGHHAWQYGPRAVFTHTAALGAALLLSEVVFKMWAPAPTKTTRQRVGTERQRSKEAKEEVEVGTTEAPVNARPSTNPTPAATESEEDQLRRARRVYSMLSARASEGSDKCNMSRFREEMKVGMGTAQKLYNEVKDKETV